MMKWNSDSLTNLERKYLERK
ncbi:hypothetical protein [Microcoleus sp. MOSTC5]